MFRDEDIDYAAPKTIDQAATLLSDKGDRARILAGGTVRNSVLSRWVRVESGALVEDSVILDNCEIGRDAKIRRAILDKNVRVAEGLSIGYDLDQDRKLHHVTESGIVVVEGLRSALEISTVVV